MKTDGLIPFACANDGKWPVMGTFDIFNLRLNGYEFHVDLMAGKEDWTTDKVKNVFSTWTELLPYHQENANGRTWQEAAHGARDARKTGMYLARHVRRRSNSTDQTISTTSTSSPTRSSTTPIGTDSIDAPIDGFMMAAKPEERGRRQGGARRTSARPTPIDAYLADQPGQRSPANSKADTSRLQRRSRRSRPSSSATAKSSPSSSTATPAPTSRPTSWATRSPTSIADPTQIDSILSDIEDQKKVIVPR